MMALMHLDYDALSFFQFCLESQHVEKNILGFKYMLYFSEMSNDPIWKGVFTNILVGFRFAQNVNGLHFLKPWFSP